MVLVWSFQNSPHLSLIFHPRWPPQQDIVENIRIYEENIFKNDFRIFMYDPFFTYLLCVLPRFPMILSLHIFCVFYLDPYGKGIKQLIFRNYELD